MSGADANPSVSSPPVARVVVDVALDKAFDYAVPPALREVIELGSQVVVPFGRRTAEGFVISLEAQSDFPDLKAILRLAHERPLIDPKVMRLAKWMADYYAAPIETAVRTVLPGAVRRQGASFKKQLFVTPAEKSGQESELAVLRRRAPRQAAALDILLSGDRMLMSDLVRAAKVTHGTIRALESSGFVRIQEDTQTRDPLEGQEFLRTRSLKLNEEQKKALEMIREGIDAVRADTVLLHGVTGSGKTEVYLQALQHTLDAGRDAIVLVPEIALTPQTVERFRGRFGEGLAVLHSHLSDGERHDEWHRVRNGEARIVVGARSALFAPVKNLGLIVVDEEHESTYKQEESPRYQARDVAVMRGHFENAVVVLGSATPSVESVVNARNGKYRFARLDLRADDRNLPVVKVVDMRHEKHEGRPVLFSNDLVEGIRLRLTRAEQVMLFLNRRGYSHNICCPECGHIPECTDCSISLTFHKRLGYLRCHLCGHAERLPEICPSCGAKDWKYVGTGTEKIESTICKLFPHAATRRMDSDTMTSKHAYHNVLGAFRKGEIDILIGTQMIAKGLHFPNVTLVGVINADGTLHMPDFRGGERAFQLFTQVAGRAGRGDVAGEVIIQTYTPTHPAVQCARRGDFDTFIDQEIEFRRELDYPPYTRLICVHFRGEEERQVEFVAEQIYAEVVRLIDPEQVTLAPPAAAPVARIQRHWRYQMIARAKTAKAFTRPLRHVLQHLKLPRKVQVIIDVDAVSLM
ncbi:MAG: primosomal protein N' [Verrucomicrobia bacterium]|nr:primosomal protein N' [Verrucomicrobiota bacterium]MCH8511898.1 primosomal protein N' [Kiritimatiellia bacterium]